MAMHAPNRNEIEKLILASIRGCPFCGSTEMLFTWGHLVPKRMTCENCDAAWEPLMSYNGVWSLVSTKLVSVGSTGKGTELLNKPYPTEFWKKMARCGKWERGQKLKMSPKEIARQPERVVVIREIVKIRCPYCGGLYDEANDRCPYCGGKR